MNALHQACARAIADARGVEGVCDCSEEAAAAIRVVQAEAQRAVEALDWHIPGSGPPGDGDPLLIDRAAALAALASLAEEQA